MASVSNFHRVLCGNVPSLRCFFAFLWTDTLRKVRLAHLDKLETENGVLKKDRTAILCENADLKRQNEHLRQQLRWYEEQCNCQAGEAQVKT